METKLTLRLNENIIAQAKIYAQKHKISLSKMIEAYLQSITTQNKNEKLEITPFVKSLSGVISLPANFDYKKEYSDFLTKKYQ